MRHLGLGRLARLGTLVLSIELATVSALAQQAPVPAAQAAEAKKHFDQGLKLYKEKETEAALLEFEKSYELGKRPSALRNKAQCLRDLKRSAEAFAAYETLLKVHATELKPAEKADIEKALDELRLLTGEVQFAVDQPDAEVSVDGKIVGTTPLFGTVRLNSGTHKVKVTKPGFETFETEITAIQQQLVKVNVHLEIVVTTGHVAVREQNGAVCKVFIDGKEVGLAPWEGDLAPGAHTVELRADKAASDVRNVEVVAKTKQDVVLLAQALNGFVSVTAQPAGAQIFIDGAKLGMTKYEGELPPGTHQLSVSLPGYETYNAPLVVERARTTMSSVTLVEAKPVTGGPAVKGPSEADYQGVYARLGFSAYFPLHSTIYPSCTADAGPDCALTSKGFPWGGGTDLRVGYNFGVLGVEGVFAAQAHSYTAQLSNVPGSPGNPSTTDSFTFLGVGGFFGPGIRATSQGDSVRFTAGLAAGLVYKFLLQREEYNTNDSKGAALAPNDTNTTFLAPGLLLDGGIHLGSTPGTRFSIGFTLWMEFPGESTFDQSGFVAGRRISDPINGDQFQPFVNTLTRTQSVQWYLGPRLGFEFGH